MAGNIIISGSTDLTLRVWNAETGQCTHTLSGHTSTVRCMHLHGNKYEDIFYFYINLGIKFVYNILYLFFINLFRVVSGSRDASLRLWNIETGECLSIFLGHDGPVRCVQYDGRLIVSGAYDHLVKIWDAESKICLHTLSGHTSSVYCLQVSIFLST